MFMMITERNILHAEKKIKPRKRGEERTKGEPTVLYRKKKKDYSGESCVGTYYLGAKISSNVLFQKKEKCNTSFNNEYVF